MRILGCDLGSVGAGGLAIVDDGEPPQVLATVALPERQSGATFLAEVYALLRFYKPHLVICEKPWTGRRDRRPAVGMAQRERLGIVKVACEHYQLPKSRLKLIPAATMKRMVTGSGRATKQQVASIVGKIVGVKMENEHVADSVALCLCGLQQERVRKAGLKQRAKQKAWERKVKAWAG